jgi:hypothetical protein
MSRVDLKKAAVEREKQRKVYAEQHIKAAAAAAAGRSWW